MLLLGFFLILLVLLVILLVIGISPKKCLYDYDSPLNLFLYQEPSHRYSDQLVNLWIDKSWRSDGKRIPCRIEYGYDYDVPTSERKLILYSHGNAEDLLTSYQFLRELSTNLKMDVITWDPSGYGLNEVDKFERTAEGINLSLQTILEHFASDQGYKISNIILWGYSLGTGPSTHLAAQLSQKKTPPAALVLFGAYSSILDVVKDVTGKDMSKWFHERWNTKEIIPSVLAPILLMHGQNDSLINVNHANLLHSRALNAKLIIMPQSGHATMPYGECIKEVKRFLVEKNITQFL
jgi:pimeloyl-ACP methyl ester carboxylesterase